MSDTESISNIGTQELAPLLVDEESNGETDKTSFLRRQIEQLLADNKKLHEEIGGKRKRVIVEDSEEDDETPKSKKALVSATPSTSARNEFDDDTDDLQVRKTMLEIYEQKIGQIEQCMLWDRIKAGRKFMSFILDCRGNPRKGYEAITPYKHNNKVYENRLGEEIVNFNDAQFHQKMQTEMSSFKVTKEMKEFLNKLPNGKTCQLGGNLTNWLAALRGEKNGSAKRRSITVMKHNKASDECGCRSLHYHILLTFEDDCDNLGAKQFYRTATDEKLKPMKITKKQCNNPIQALCYMAEPGTGRSYMGSTDKDIARLMVKIHRFQNDASLVDSIPLPQDSAVAGAFESGSFYESTIDDKKEVITWCRDILSSKGNSQVDKLEIGVTHMVELGLGATGLKDFRASMYGLPKGRVSPLVQRALFKLLFTPHVNEMLWEMYMVRCANKEIIHSLRTIGMTWPSEIVENTIQKFKLQIKMLRPDLPWFIQLFRIYPILFKKFGKKNTAYIYGKANLGKSRIWKQGLQWITPTCYPTVAGTQFGFSELAVPHCITIIDDCDPVLDDRATKLLDQVKNMTAGTSTSVDAKYEKNLQTKTSPVIWLSNQPFFIIGCISPDNMEALKSRIDFIEMDSNYPYNDDVYFWETMHQFFMCHLQTVLKEKMTEKPEILAHLMYKHIQEILEVDYLDNILLSFCSPQLRKELTTTQTNWTEGSVHSIYENTPECSDSDDNMEKPISGDQTQ